MLQGYGLFTIEDPKYTPDGHLLTRGPGNYKLPSCTNIPIEFNVTLLKDSTNPKAVYSSKVKLQATRTPVGPTVADVKQFLWPLYFCPAVSFYLLSSSIFFPRLISAAADWGRVSLLSRCR